MQRWSVAVRCHEGHGAWMRRPERSIQDMVVFNAQIRFWFITLVSVTTTRTGTVIQIVV